MKYKIRVKTLKRGILIATAHDGRKTIGKVQATPPLGSSKYSDVGRMWVDENYRRKGIGSALYKALGDYACEKGWKLRSEGFQRSPDAGKTWASLVRKGVATSNNGGSNYKTDYEIPCEGLDLFMSAVNRFQSLG